MGKLIFKRDKYGYYNNEEEIEDVGSYHMEHFLTSEVGGSSGSFWISVLLCPNNNELFGDTTYLRKEEKKVYLGWNVIHEDPYPDPNEYQTTKEELLKAIYAWVELRKENVKTIILEVNDENISIYSEEDTTYVCSKIQS